jgi:hypothetical protein
MAKVYLNLPNDITDRSVHIGLADMFKRQGIQVYTEVGHLKGETIDVAYLLYDETLISKLADMRIKKLSIFSKGDDDIVVPKNFVKFSSEKMLSMSNTYNIVLNHKAYKAETEIIMCGSDDIHQDIVRNVYMIFGNVISCQYGKYDVAAMTNSVRTRNIPNSDNMYFNVFAMLDGLKQCTIKKNIVKVGTTSNVLDLKPIINALSTDKLVITNLDVKKPEVSRYSIGNFIIAGKYEQMQTMFTNAHAILLDKVNSLRKKMRLEYTYDQILVLGYMKDSFDYMKGPTVEYARSVMKKMFQIVSIDELGYYWIQYGNQVLTNFPSVQPDVYNKHCFVKSTNDL